MLLTALGSAEKFSELGGSLRSIPNRTFRCTSLFGSKTLRFAQRSYGNTSFNIVGFSTEPQPRNSQIGWSDNFAKSDASIGQLLEGSAAFEDKTFYLVYVNS
jgi:hypothetical protein